MINRIFNTIEKDPGLAIILILLVILGFMLACGSFQFN
jgi:LPS O-antigen subunit length determinant protein (WzzB/FepE family)